MSLARRRPEIDILPLVIAWSTARRRAQGASLARLALCGTIVLSLLGILPHRHAGPGTLAACTSPVGRTFIEAAHHPDQSPHLEPAASPEQETCAACALQGSRLVDPAIGATAVGFDLASLPASSPVRPRHRSGQPGDPRGPPSRVPA